jgi:hypothetical protein
LLHRNHRRQGWSNRAALIALGRAGK